MKPQPLNSYINHRVNIYVGGNQFTGTLSSIHPNDDDRYVILVKGIGEEVRIDMDDISAIENAH